MQITCPNCGETVPAENINIQQMGAVCPYCNSVFRFDLPGDKIKRRKVKPPEKINITETDNRLDLAFRTNFRLDRDEAFLNYSIASVTFTLVTFLLIAEALAGEINVFVPVVTSMLTAFFYYSVALRVLNHTHIDINEEQIAVSRQPLPNIIGQPNQIGLAGVESIRYAETPVSKREGYDTPRYNVWAQMVNGSRKMIVTDVIEDYAVFIAQELNSYLDLQDDPIQTHLVDDAFIADDEPSQQNTSVR